MAYSRLLISSLTFLFCSFVMADEPKQIIDKLFENTGLQSVLVNVPQQIRLQAKENQLDEKQSYSPEDEEILFKYLEPEYLHASFLNYMTRELDSQTLNTLLSQTKTPVVKNILQIESETSKTDESLLQKQMATYFDSLNTSPPPQTRMDLIMELESASKATDSIVYLMDKVLRGINQVMSTGKEAVNNQQVEQEITMATLMMQNVAKTQIIMMMHFTYRDVKDEDLKTYLDMLLTPEKQRFLNTSVEALGTVFLDALEKGFEELKAIKMHRPAVAI